MIHYRITMEHSKESFEALSHMQYDLFCTSNRITRSIIAIAAILCGLLNSSHWWAILLIAYGCYLTTSTYSAANHTAHKLLHQVEASGLGFPKSEFFFHDGEAVITPIPAAQGEKTVLPYKDILRLGEDAQYFYLFCDKFGGYMIPKKELGQKDAAFRAFMERASGQKFHVHKAPILRLIDRIQAKKQAGQ